MRSATWSRWTGRSKARWSRSTGARFRSGPPATTSPPSPTASSPSRASSIAACRRPSGADSVVRCRATRRSRRSGVIELVHRAVLLCPRDPGRCPRRSWRWPGSAGARTSYKVGFSVARSGLLGPPRATCCSRSCASSARPGWAARLAAASAVSPRPPGSHRAARSSRPFPCSRTCPPTRVSSLPGAVDPARAGAGPGPVRPRRHRGLAVHRRGRRARGHAAHRGRVVTSVGRISAGDYIGEIGMLTGAPHAATVTALTACTVFELRKEQVAPLLAEQPDLVHEFELSARRGQALIDRSVAASVGAATDAARATARPHPGILPLRPLTDRRVRCRFRLRSLVVGTGRHASSSGVRGASLE